MNAVNAHQALAAAETARAFLAGAYTALRRRTTEWLAPSRLPRP